MRQLLAAVVALSLAACDQGSEPIKIESSGKKPGGAAGAGEATTGKNTCLCGAKTDEDNCPKCGASLVASEKPATAKPSTPATGAEVGKSTVGGLFGCPEAGCDYTEAKENTCLVHKTTKLKPIVFACAACGKEEVQAGKCAGCGKDLTRKLK